MKIKECKLSENAHKNSYCDLEENVDEDNIISESFIKRDKKLIYSQDLV